MRQYIVLISTRAGKTEQAEGLVDTIPNYSNQQDSGDVREHTVQPIEAKGPYSPISSPIRANQEQDVDVSYGREELGQQMDRMVTRSLMSSLLYGSHEQDFSNMRSQETNADEGLKSNDPPLVSEEQVVSDGRAEAGQQIEGSKHNSDSSEEEDYGEKIIDMLRQAWQGGGPIWAKTLRSIAQSIGLEEHEVQEFLVKIMNDSAIRQGIPPARLPLETSSVMPSQTRKPIEELQDNHSPPLSQEQVGADQPAVSQQPIDKSFWQ